MEDDFEVLEGSPHGSCFVGVGCRRTGSIALWVIEIIQDYLKVLWNVTLDSEYNTGTW